MQEGAQRSPTETDGEEKEVSEEKGAWGFSH